MTGRPLATMETTASVEPGVQSSQTDLPHEVMMTAEPRVGNPWLWKTVSVSQSVDAAGSQRVQLSLQGSRNGRSYPFMGSTNSPRGTLGQAPPSPSPEGKSFPSERCRPHQSGTGPWGFRVRSSVIGVHGIQTRAVDLRTPDHADRRRVAPQVLCIPALSGGSIYRNREACAGGHWRCSRRTARGSLDVIIAGFGRER